MEEILPWIEAKWKECAISEGMNVNKYNVDESQLSPELVRSILMSDIILITAFNMNILRAMELVRLKLKLKTPFIFYLHGMATIGLWPLKSYINIPLFTNDQFIATCDGDIECVKLVIKNPNITKISFDIPPIKKLKDSKKYWKDEKGIYNLCYIGRISRQKNIDLLIQAVSMLENTKLHIFGEEDLLDSPNMGLKRDGYKQALDLLVKKLKLTQKVIFYGYQSRDSIYSFLKKENHTFISASLHSDENFGMAAYRSLRMGAKVILSDWGGHQNMINKKSSLVTSIPLIKDSIGVNIKVIHIKEAILKSRDKKIEPYFSLENQINPKIISCLNKSLNEECEPTVYNKVLSQIIQNKEIYKEKEKIFSSYKDPLANLFLDSYARKNLRYEEIDESNMRR